MLWSDPRDEPPEELHDTQIKLRRAALLVALSMVLIMTVIGVL